MSTASATTPTSRRVAALVFGVGDASYSLLWQQVGDFTTVETDRLRALAERVLARA